MAVFTNVNERNRMSSSFRVKQTEEGLKIDMTLLVQLYTNNGFTLVKDKPYNGPEDLSIFIPENVDLWYQPAMSSKLSEMRKRFNADIKKLPYYNKRSKKKELGYLLSLDVIRKKYQNTFDAANLLLEKNSRDMQIWKPILDKLGEIDVAIGFV